jgi:LysM repeat protein
VLKVHLTSVARGRVAFVAGAVVLGLALTACDSGDDDDAAAAESTAPADLSVAAPRHTYVVDSGDSLSGIAAGHGVALSELVAINGWSDGSAHAIFPGDVIVLPDDAVAVSTTRPPNNDTDDDDADGATAPTTTPSATATPAPTATQSATTSGGYTATGQQYAGPALDGATDPVADPLADGVYWSPAQTVSADGSTIVFDLVQRFSGEACREHFGTAPGSCIGDIGYGSATATAPMRVGQGTVSVLEVDGIDAPEAYRITSAELARLLAAQTPADDAPGGFVFDPVDSFVVTVRDGVVTAADQIWGS